MLGKQSSHVGQLQPVTVEALVPAKYVLRRLHASLDPVFVRVRVASLYSRFGRPSVNALTPSPARGEPKRSAPAATASLRLKTGGRPQASLRRGDPEWHGERFSNATHRSTTDPEARLYRKSDGQEAKLRYLGHYLADVRGGVIDGVMAIQATATAEQQAALALLDGLAVVPEELAADLGYRDGDFLAAVLQRGVQPLVPLQDELPKAEPTWKPNTTNPLRRPFPSHF